MPNFLRLAIPLTVFLLTGCSDSDIPGTPSSENIRFGYYGATYRSPAVTLSDLHSSYWAQEIVTDYQPADISQKPATFSPVHLNFDCEIPSLSRGTYVAAVEIYGGSVELPLYFIPNQDIDKFREVLAESDRPPNFLRTLEQGIVKKVDVYITETEKPVYLVLGAYDETVWSLHLSEQTRLEGVAVIGYEAQALANVPEGTPIGFVVYDSNQMECRTYAQRPVNETWTSLQKINNKHGGSGFQYTIDKAKERHDEFHEWLGLYVDLPDTVISAYYTSHVLVGPKPTTRIPYHSLADTQIFHSGNVLPLWGEIGEAEEALVGLINETS